MFRIFYKMKSPCYLNESGNYSMRAITCSYYYDADAYLAFLLQFNVYSISLFSEIFIVILTMNISLYIGTLY